MIKAVDQNLAHIYAQQLSRNLPAIQACGSDLLVFGNLDAFHEFHGQDAPGSILPVDGRCGKQGVVFTVGGDGFSIAAFLNIIQFCPDGIGKFLINQIYVDEALPIGKPFNEAHYSSDRFQVDFYQLIDSGTLDFHCGLSPIQQYGSVYLSQ